MADGGNIFDDMIGSGDVQNIGPVVSQQQQQPQDAEPAKPGENVFDQMVGSTDIPVQSSAGGAFTRGMVGGAAPGLGGLAAAGYGAAVGSTFGPWGTLAGGLVGGLGGSAAISAVQNWGLSKLPASWVEKLGQDDRQKQLDEMAHPAASFLGGIAPYAITMSPMGLAKAAESLPANATAFQRVMANPLTGRLFGGGVMGGMELGQEEFSGEHRPNWTHVAIATGFGMVFNRPNQIGEAIEGAGTGAALRHNFVRAGQFAHELNASEPEAAPPPSLFPTEAAPERPLTVAQAGDTKVMGPGITEDVFHGSQEQSPATAMTAQDAARTEASVLGPEPPKPDVGDMARRMEPELFSQYDALSAQRDEFRGWVDDLQGTPTDDATARQRLKEADDAMTDLEPQIAAAYRRAAEHSEGPDALAPQTPAAPEPTHEEKTAAEATTSFIASDVARKLIAAGRPADEAEAAGALVAARHQTRADLFNGALGTPEELYSKESADIRAGQKPSARKQPLPKEPAAREAEVLERSADPDVPPEEVAAKDIETATASAPEPPAEAIPAATERQEMPEEAAASPENAEPAAEVAPIDTAQNEATSETNPEAMPGEPAAVGAEEPQNERGSGAVEPAGEAVRGGTPEVPEGSEAARPEKPRKIRGPRKLSAFGGEPGGGNAHDDDGAAPEGPGGAEPSLSEDAGIVTGPPANGPRDGQARPDTPAGIGVSQAREKIAERSRSNYRITDADAIGTGGPKQKIQNNIEAVRVLKAIEDEGRDATQAEKAVLVKYSGWGAFAQDMFSPYKNTFKTERDAFRALVTDEEFESARASTLNAHYTSPNVIQGMWDALTHFGYDGGVALEPSAGVGHFIGLIPDSVAPRTAWAAVELDPLTGRIAKSLYGGAEVNVQGYETLKRPSNYYDLIISNVPFGNYNLREKPYGAYPIHDFFFVKSLDKVRPGGVVAFVTSRYTMDRVDGATRRELAKSADLIGAIRLPGGNKGAFAGNAGTQVTTDILFLRKRIPDEVGFEGAKWADVKEIHTPEGPASINEYFADKPEQMLGEMRLQGSMYSANEPVLIGDTENLRTGILEAARRMPEGAFAQRAAPEAPQIHANDIEGNVKDGGYFVKDGDVYRRVNGAGEPQNVGAQDQDRISRFVGMRDLVNDLLRTQISSDPAAKEQSEHLREKLRTAYDDFVAKHGPINKETRTVTKRIGKNGEPIVSVRRPNLSAFEEDPDAFKVAAIEKYNSETDKATRATIQTKDVISPPRERQINSASDALAAVLDDKGHVDLQAIGDMMGAKTEDEVVNRLGDLIYQNPDGRAWEPVDAYLSGDVVKKLEDARAVARSESAYLRNVTALEKVQPTPLAPSDIVAQFGAPWIPEDVYTDFLNEIGGNGVTVRQVPVTGEWKVKAKYYSRDAISKFGTDRANVDDVVDAALNNRQITVYDKFEDGTRTINQAATEQARIKVESLKEAFTGDSDAGIDGWVFNEPDRADRLAGIYNRTYNNLVNRKFDGSHLTMPGMSADLTLRSHQKDSIWRTIQNGNTLLAHVMGAGKTFTMIGSSMEQRRLGLVNKPMHVVPNHMLEQYSREFLQAYPDANILVANKDEMTPSARKAFIGKIAANDLDAVIITHDAFGRINMDQEFRQSHVRDQLDQLRRIIEAEAANGGKNDPTVKALEKAKKKLEGSLEALLNEERKDEGTSFEETGVDFLYFDEAHLFKNLSFNTRLQRVKGMSQGHAQRAEDLFMKMRYLEQKRQGRAGVFATGTPVSNTMAELWTMQRYLQYDRLKERGLDNFDNWASTFGRVVNNMELGADGRTFKEVSSFSKFVNVPELISLYSEIADTKTADMLKLPRPEVMTRAGKPGIEIVQAEPSPQEEAHIDALVKLAESLKGQRPMPGMPNMLSVVTEGRKVATDGRLIDPERFDFNSLGKVAHAVNNIARIYHDGKEPARTQMVFLDMGVPGGKGKAARSAVRAEDSEGGEAFDPAEAAPSKINLYDDIKQRLVEKGLKPSEVAFIHDAPDDEKKARLFAKVRSGEVRVLIGSSGKMGVGTNVQDRLIAMHHLDAPWRPSDVEQRDGRIVRQGNLNPEVQIYRYITKRSFDAFMWQKLDAKSKFIGQVLSGAKGSRHAEDVDNPLPEAAEMKAAASGDPRIMEHAELSRQVRQLASQKRAFESTVSRATWELGSAKARIAEYEGSLGTAKADAGRVSDLSGDNFKVEIGGQTETSRKEAGQRIVSKLTSGNVQDYYRPKALKVGTMSGFTMSLDIETKWDGSSSYLKATASLTGDGKYSAVNAFALNPETDPVGLMRQFEGILKNIGTNPQRIEANLAAEKQSVQKLAVTAQTKWPRVDEYRTAQQKLNDLATSMKAPEEKPAEIAAEPQSKEYEQSAQGKIKFVDGKRPVISLFKEADASTFLHETGHQWLEELMRDAAHPLAPDGLKADAKTIRDWLGVKTAAEIKTSHHEKFARGFEQYLREGIAPSRALADVFTRFRNFLVQIYKNVEALGAPISDEVRGVFDRLIAREPDHTVVTQERARQPSLADIHEADAAETSPAEAGPAADRVAAEATRFEADLPEEIRRELETVTPAEAPEPGEAAGSGSAAGAEPGGEAGNGANGGAEVGGGSGQSEPVAERGMGSKATGALGDGGSDASAESVGAGRGRDGGPGSANAAGAGDLAPTPATVFGPDESPFLDKAGNIRLDTLTSDEDVMRAIHTAADENNDFIGDRRGWITDGQMEELADALGMDVSMLNQRKIGQAFNAEQVIAARRLLISSAKDVSAKMRKAALDGSADEDILAYAMAKDRHQMIQAQVAGITAEAGRALRAFRKLAGQESVASVDQFIRTATGKTLYQLRIEAKLGAKLDTPSAVSKFIDDARKRTFGRMLLEYWINGLISGPATHVTYSIGNTLLAIERAGPETAAAALIGRARAAMGRDGERVHMGEVGAQFSGAVRGLAPAIKASAESLRSGTTTLLPGETPRKMPFQPDAELAFAQHLDETAGAREALGSVFGLVRGIYDGVISGGALLAGGGVEGEPLFGTHYSPAGAIPDITMRGVNVLPLGTAARMPSRFVAAIHSFFRAMNYSMEKNALAYHQAMEEGHKGTDFDARVADLRQNPTEVMMDQARQEATDATLMGRGGAFTQALSRLTNIAVKVPIVGEMQILKFIDPFVHISSNVIEQSLIKRSPLGALLSSQVRADLMSKNPVVADKAAARMLVGTALSLAFGGLAAEGMATGSGPSDPRKAAMWRLAGNQAYSVRIGDIWYGTHRLGPLGMIMGVAADLYDVAHQIGKGDASKVAGSVMFAISQNILDESFMRGPADLIQAMHDPARYGGSWVRNFASSFMPYSVGMAQMARAADPYSRQAHTLVDSIKRKVPGLSESLMPRRDIWGEPMPNNPALISSAVTAIYETKVSQDPVNQAMLQLGIAPAQVTRKIRNVPLTDQQYDDYARIAGRMAKMRLDVAVKSPDWGRLPPEAQHNVIQAQITMSREVARNIMMLKYPTIIQAATAAKLARLRGQ